MKILITAILLTDTVLFLGCLGKKSPPVIKLPTLGKIEGSFEKSLSGRTIYTFKGVPYAQPPVGAYRYRAPAPPKPWLGTWQAKTKHRCIQYYQYTEPNEDKVFGNEDCLYLNIYTPTLKAKANLDVIVYIHGGAFMFNYNDNLGPQFLLDQDVVFVTINYRLGPLGFLSTEDDTIPANIGLRDQAFALEWIKNHIAHFGGNPESVTITGTSAGGASVHFHYLSPKSRGLFHRGISQSGSALNNWALTEKPLEHAQKLATHLGCPNVEDTEKIIDCLRKRPARQIVQAVRQFQPWLYNPFTPFGVVVDNWSSDPVLPEHPYKLLKEGNVANLPWMISQTNSEGLYPATDFYVKEEYLEEIDNRWNELMPHIMDYNYTLNSKLHDEVSEKIRHYYMDNKKVSRDTYMDLVELCSDRFFVVDLQTAARLQASVSEAPVFFYYFTYRGGHSFSEETGTNEDFGAAHADEMIYVFNMSISVFTSDNDRLMSKLLVKMFTSFAKNGKAEMPVDWMPLPRKIDETLVYLEIASPTNVTLKTGEILKSGEFWKALPIEENEKLFQKSNKEEL